MKLLETVVAEVNFSKRKTREAARREIPQVVVAQIQSLQVTQLGQSIRAHLKVERQVLKGQLKTTKHNQIRVFKS